MYSWNGEHDKICILKCCLLFYTRWMSRFNKEVKRFWKCGLGNWKQLENLGDVSQESLLGFDGRLILGSKEYDIIKYECLVGKSRRMWVSLLEIRSWQTRERTSPSRTVLGREWLSAGLYKAAEKYYLTSKFLKFGERLWDHCQGSEVFSSYDRNW